MGQLSYLMNDYERCKYVINNNKVIDFALFLEEEEFNIFSHFYNGYCDIFNNIDVIIVLMDNFTSYFILLLYLLYIYYIILYIIIYYIYLLLLLCFLIQ